MTQCNTLNLQLSNSQLNKLKSGIKNNAEVTLKTSSNAVGDSNDENNFSHNLLLTNTKVSKLRKAFANGSSANIKLSKTQLHKIGQSGGFLGRILGSLLKTGLPLIRNAPLAKSVLIPLGLTVAPSATEAAVRKKTFGSGTTTSLIISNEEMHDIVKIIRSLEKSCLSIKGVGVSETIKIEAKEQKERFLIMHLGTLGASSLGNLLTGKGTIRAGEDTLGADQGFQCCLIL